MPEVRSQLDVRREFEAAGRKEAKASQAFREVLGDEPGWVLDVGAGNLVCAHRFVKSGCKVDALEPSTDRPDGYGVLDEATCGSMKLHRTKFEDYRPMEREAGEMKQYDLIFMNHTLEHTRDPWAWLEKAASLLTERGGIYIAVPSIEASWSWDHPEHFALVGHHKYLDRMLRECGFFNFHFLYTDNNGETQVELRCWASYARRWTT